MHESKIETLPLAQIVASQGRELDMKVIASMAESIKMVGLQNPISVVADPEGVYRVISGRHRIAAVRAIGRDHIEALVHYDLSEIEVRLAEIVENLHRAELTALQRSEQIAEYAKLVKERRKEGAAQVGQHPSNVKGASGRESGESAAARELNLTRQELQRAEKIAKLTPEAKTAAKKAALDNNQSAMLKVAAAPKEQQQVVITELFAAKARKRPNPRSGKDVDETVEAILRDFSAFDVQLIINALNLAVTPAVKGPHPVSDGGVLVLERRAAGLSPSDVALSTDDVARAQDLAGPQKQSSRAAVISLPPDSAAPGDQPHPAQEQHDGLDMFTEDPWRGLDNLAVEEDAWLPASEREIEIVAMMADTLI